MWHQRAQTITDLLKETAREWLDDKVPRHAAALAFYTLLSLAPLLLLVVSLVSLVVAGDVARQTLVEETRRLAGDTGASAVETVLRNAGTRSSGIIGTVVSIAAVLFGATGVFAQLQGALNEIWGLAPKPGRAVRAVVEDRLLSFAAILGIGLLLLASFVISAGLTAVAQAVGGAVAGPEAALRVLNLLFSLALFTLLFALTFKILPDAIIRWRDVWVGAGVTAALFATGNLLIGLYLGHSTAGSSYGAAGSLVVLLIWIYYSAQIVLFGAEFTQVYARRHGVRIRPDSKSVRVRRKTTDTGAQSQTQTPVSTQPAPGKRPEPPRT
ncbi:MAG: YihY/virulence factor BrkB family protein [Thermoleophilia bacterium]|nr:YihY/virulence factor BrkB family protein [Thermoleophilia bacterium]